jgi:hypothetical protein
VLASLISSCLSLEEILFQDLPSALDSWNKIISACAARHVAGRPRIRLAFPTEQLRDSANQEPQTFDQLLRLLVSEASQYIDWKWMEPLADRLRFGGLSSAVGRNVPANGGHRVPSDVQLSSSAGEKPTIQAVALSVSPAKIGHDARRSSVSNGADSQQLSRRRFVLTDNRADVALGHSSGSATAEPRHENVRRNLPRSMTALGTVSLPSGSIIPSSRIFETPRDALAAVFDDETSPQWGQSANASEGREAASLSTSPEEPQSFPLTEMARKSREFVRVFFSPRSRLQLSNHF